MTDLTQKRLLVIALGLIMLAGCAHRTSAPQDHALRQEIKSLAKENQRLRQENKDLRQRLDELRNKKPSWQGLRQRLQTLLEDELDSTRRSARDWLRQFEQQLDKWQRELSPSPPQGRDL
jgi:cell division protein FtsB